MLDIQKSIKRIIERFIVNQTPITSALNIGDTSIPIESSRRYQCDDEVVIFHQESSSASPEGEVHTIVDVPDNDHIVIDSGLVEAYPLSNSYVEKMVGGTFLASVYLGEPDVISHFPAISINAKSKSNSWLTLESTTAEYHIDITVYVQDADYERQYEVMHNYLTAIESSLFRSLYPLVQPYDSTTLSEDVTSGDTLIRLTDEDMLLCGNSAWIFLESYDFLRYNTVRRSLGNGVYELWFPISRDFSAGDLVIRPRRHIYNTLPSNIQYGSINKGGMIKAGVISLELHEETRRYVPYIDSLIR